MAFGAAGLGANLVIRNNRNLLKKKKKEQKLSFVSDVNEKWVDPKKATFNQLLEIRNRIRRENVTRTRKMIILTIILLTICILCALIMPWGLIFTQVH